MDVQALEQAVAQETGSGVQALGAFLGVAHQQTEVHLGVGIVRRHLDGVDRDHTHAGVLEFAGDELRQIALDLVGHSVAAVGNGRGFARHYKVLAISLISKNSS